MNRSATIIRLAAQVFLLWSPALRVPAQSAVPLTDHMIAQLASRTNGTACGSYGLIAGNNSFSTSPVMAANFWLAGVTNINAEGNSLANGALFPGGLTMVSPRHCVNAAHVGYSVMNVWILPGGALYTNSVLAATNDGDIQIELMARTNPFFAKIFPNATNQIGRWQRRGSGALPLFVRRHRGSNPLYWYETNPAYEPTFVSGASSLGSFTAESEVRFGDYLESGDRNGPASWPAGDRWISGDSGGPAYGIINNEAVLVGCATSPNFAEPLGLRLATLNHLMAWLSTNHAAPVYALTLYDLSAFPIVDSKNVPSPPSTRFPIH